MHPVRLVGNLALAVGGGLLLSNLFLGPAVLIELMGPQWKTLQLLCGMLVGVGPGRAHPERVGNESREPRGDRAARCTEEEVRMTIRLVKFYVAAAICVCALYVFWIGIGECVGILSPKRQLLGAVAAIGVSFLGLGLGGRLGWKTVLEELAVKCD
jgi:hypothetical protein